VLDIKKRKTDPNCKPSKAEKRRRRELILKAVFRCASWLYASYKAVSKLIDFFKEFAD